MKNFSKFLLFWVILAGIAFAVTCYQLNKPPKDVWQQLIDYVQKQINGVPPEIARPTPPPAPVLPPPPKPAPPPLPVVAEIPKPAPPPPPPDPLSWSITHRDLGPQEVTLLADTTFPILVNGHVAGSGNVPAGSALKLLQIDPDKQTLTVACVAYGNSTLTLPFASTDILDRAKAAMAKADADAKAADAQKIADAKTADAQKLAAASTPPVPPPTPAEPPAAALTADTSAPSGATVDTSTAFVHPGLLHNDTDFARMKEHIHDKPWNDGWERLIQNRHAQLDYTPHPVAIVVRGKDRSATAPENYARLFNDIAAAYACALRWRISGDTKYADKSVEIMNAWSSTLTKVTGSTDADLAAGIYGYEFANAAEIMRSYPGWKPEDFARFQSMMLNVFYPINHDFLIRHNNTKIDHYWANWDACNMDSVLAIGVLCDRRDIYNEAINYFKFGEGNGAIKQAVWFIHPDGLGQWQESGRDQGHTMMGIGQIGAFCEMAWKQGDDMYGYDNNRFLAGCEYVAKYNSGEDVPFKPFSDSLATQPVISSNARGNVRPVWELVYNHYVKLKGLSAPYTTKMAESVRPEGGGGDYGPNSGGFDQLGYGTLTATLSDKPDATNVSDATHP